MTALGALREHLRLIKSQGKTVIIAEHRLHYLTDVADRIIYLENGSIAGDWTPEQFRLLSEAYSKEKAQLAEAIPATEERLEKLRSSMANAKNFIAKARKFTDMTELTKHAPQKIHICFRDFNLNETDDMLLCGETTEKADSTIALPA